MLSLASSLCAQSESPPKIIRQYSYMQNNINVNSCTTATTKSVGKVSFSNITVLLVM